MFGTILISICTLMHIYVFWRVSSVSFLRRYVPLKILISAGLVLWVVFYLGRTVGHGGTGLPAALIEFAGMNWMGALFLIFLSLLALDLITLFGLLMPRLSDSSRGWTLLAGVLLSLIALFQGLRPPVIQKYEVFLPGLPEAMEGTVLMALSDMHLGSQIGERWLASRIKQVAAEQPDLVVLLGDIFEGHEVPGNRLQKTFKRLTAPLGVWAVPGNHEFHGKNNLQLFGELGFTLLRNEWAEITPGLILAGVDDLTSMHRRGMDGDIISKTLAGRPQGATILLSHTPWQADKAAEAGVNLMLSGHTHGGQIWPLGYLFRQRYPLLQGRYEIPGMTVIVSRGTGTWGPRMRLWRPAEILRITLRGKAFNSGCKPPGILEKIALSKLRLASFSKAGYQPTLNTSAAAVSPAAQPAQSP